MIYLTFLCVAVDLCQLDHEVTIAIGAAWAPNTRATRNSQWKKYLTFCHDNELNSIPAEPQTVARFLVYLARTVKYSTINNYVSAINRLHDYYGHHVNFRETFLIKLVLAGIKRQLGDCTIQKIPLTPCQLLCMFASLDMDNSLIHALWCGIILCFRTLLRKSNIVPDSSHTSGHILLRKDVVFTDNGMILEVHSTKTIQYHERVLRIPVMSIPGSPLCAVSLLKEHFAKFPMPPNSMLLYKSTPVGPQAIVYRELLSFLKDLVKCIGLNPNDVGLHSLRRSGASFLHSIQIPLEDIKCAGDWKSLAVLEYLITPLDRKMDIENLAVTALSSLSV